MSSSNSVLLAYAPESTYGEVPSGPPTLKNLRMVSESFSQDTEYAVSEELRSDEQEADSIRVFFSSSGDLPIELSYAAYDDLLLAVMKAAAWSSVVTVTGSFECEATGNKLKRGSGSWISDAIPVGQWIRVKGFTTNGPEFYVKVAARTSTELDVVGKTLVDEGPTGSIEVEVGAYIENGTTFRSYHIERQYTDLSNEFVRFSGVVWDRFSLDVSSRKIVTGSFGAIGKAEASATSTFGDGSNTAAPTNPIMNAVDNVVSLLEANATFKAQQFTLNMARNHRVRDAIGVAGAESIGSGSIALTGTLKANYASAAFFNKYLGNQTTSFAVILKDSDGNAIIVEIPRAKFSAGKRVGGGKNTDVIADVSFRATMHPTELKTMRIAKFAA